MSEKVIKIILSVALASVILTGIFSLYRANLHLQDTVKSLTNEVLNQGNKISSLEDDLTKLQIEIAELKKAQ